MKKAAINIGAPGRVNHERIGDSYAGLQAVTPAALGSPASLDSLWQNRGGKLLYLPFGNLIASYSEERRPGMDKLAILFAEGD